MIARTRRGRALSPGAAAAASVVLAAALWAPAASSARSAAGADNAAARPPRAHAGGTLTITAVAQPAELPIGNTITVSGRALAGTAPAPGTALTLQSAPYPYPSFTATAHAVSGPDGAFAFTGIAPRLNSRLRVIAEGPATSAALPVIVDPTVALAARSLGPGRVRLSLRIAHTTEAGGAAADAQWYLAPRGSLRFVPAATIALRERSSGVSYAAAIVNPPSRRFVYRVCLNPPWEAAMGPPAAHGPCPRHAFTLPRARAAFQYGGEGRGTPAPPYPSQRAITAAERWLDARAGATALAVVDSSGRLSGLRMRAHFQTASVIKVMFLAAYLQRLAGARRPLGAHDRALLYPMIHESNNDAASAVLSTVGESAVERVARETGMRDYAPGVGWWAFSQTSAADQAQLLSRLAAVMPRRFYGYARYLMSTIEPEQSWGFPPVARPRWQVFFKTGALPSRGLFNEVALLERNGVAFSVAVLTDHVPSQSYGEETIAGVARALLGAQ